MKISQREARRLRKRVTELEQVIEGQRSRWASEWPRGVNICCQEVHPTVAARIETARVLGHAVVCVSASNNIVKFFADELK